MKYNVVEVESRKHLKDFLSLPYLIYSNDENWVAPMITEVKRTLSKRNPYFVDAEYKLFNCYYREKICARASVVINKRYRNAEGLNTAFFGFFECLPDEDAAKVIFDAIEKYCRTKNVDVIEGPFNPNHYSELGLQVNNFNTEPAFFQTYNPANYLQMLENCGFRIANKLYTMKNDNIGYCLKSRYKAILPESSEEYKIRCFSMNDMKRDLNYMRDIFNDAFQYNKYFLPLSNDEYLYSAKYLKYVTRPDLIKFVEHKNTPVGCLHLVLDINPLLKVFYGKFNLFSYLNFLKKKDQVKNLIIFAVGVKSLYRRSPAYALLLNSAINLAKNCSSLETTWISENNSAAINAANKLMLHYDKEFVILSKSIQ